LGEVQFVTAGLSGNFALAGVGQELKADLKYLKGDIKAHIDQNRPINRVPEPLLGVGFIGLGIFGLWRRMKSTI
jgi:hypothetical protein